MRGLGLLLLFMTACRPGGAPTDAPAIAGAAATVEAPAPEVEAPLPWAWAVAVLPELAEHSEVDPGVAALGRFVAWFPGGAGRVHVLHAGRCRALEGEVDADGFYGSWDRRVTTTGDMREVTVMSVAITRFGIEETGPSGQVFERDRGGRWREAGSFAVGSFGSLVDRPMSAADEQAVTFAGQRYSLAAVCREFAAVDQRCSDGGRRRCQRCVAVGVDRREDAWSVRSPTLTSVRAATEPVDCSRACPDDPAARLVTRLAAVLQGRGFVGARAEVGPVVFRRAQDCERERRRVRSRG